MVNFVLQHSDLRDVYEKVAAGRRIDESDALRLFESKNLNAVGVIADLVRERKAGNRASYIINRITEHFGDVIGFGEPLVRQLRNPHDLWKDLDVERNGMILTDDFCAALRSIPLTGATYHQCFGQIADALPRAWTPGLKWTESQKEWRSKLVEGMGIWHAAFEAFGAGDEMACRSDWMELEEVGGR